MTTTATNHEADKKRDKPETKPSGPASTPAAPTADATSAAAKETKPPISKTRALRLMLNILERTDVADRPSLLASLGSLA